MSRPEASGSEPANTSTISGPDTATERPLLVEFAELWNRGLADERKLWELFDVSEMYLYKPDYFGAPVFTFDGQLVSPVFSTPQRLAEFLVDSETLHSGNVEGGYDWVLLTGAGLFGLPLRARWLMIDPGARHQASVDLADRADPPALADGAPPFAIDLELGADGMITSRALKESLHYATLEPS